MAFRKDWLDGRRRWRGKNIYQIVRVVPGFGYDRIEALRERGWSRELLHPTRPAFDENS